MLLLTTSQVAQPALAQYPIFQWTCLSVTFSATLELWFLDNPRTPQLTFPPFCPFALRCVPSTKRREHRGSSAQSQHPAGVWHLKGAWGPTSDPDTSPWIFYLPANFVWSSVLGHMNSGSISEWKTILLMRRRALSQMHNKIDRNISMDNI